MKSVFLFYVIQNMILMTELVHAATDQISIASFYMYNVTFYIFISYIFLYTRVYLQTHT